MMKILYLLLTISSVNNARDVCTKSAVLEELGIIKGASPKSVPIYANVKSHNEVVDKLGKHF